MNNKTRLIMSALVLATLPVPGLAGTVGSEYCQQDACGNGNIPNTKPDASGFASWMQAFGHTKKFLYGNASFWPKDPVRTAVNGLDTWYGDNVNHLYMSTHGSSNSARFFLTTGATQTIDGLSTCASYTHNPNNGKLWWQLGDGSLRTLHLATCEGLELSDLAHWDSVANGLHLITGYDGTMADTPSAGGVMAMYGGLGFSIKQAHFMSRTSGDKAVIMAYGVSQGDALNRRDNEKFTWSMARLGPHSWRAWSWIQ